MPQNVPEFRFSDDALKLRQFVYEHWCTHGHGPNLRAAHEATGLSREQILEAYKQLDLGIMCIQPLREDLQKDWHAQEGAGHFQQR